MSSKHTQLSLWLKSEVFNIGALPIPPSNRLSFKNIKKIVSYIKTKDPANFPMLSFSTWKHIACHKLSFPEDLAWVYFSAFDLLKDKTPDERIIFWDSLIFSKSDGSINQVFQHGLKADGLLFSIFLFLQHLHKISLKSSLISGSEEWPSRNKSSESESKLNLSGLKGSDESMHLNFVLNNLDSLLDLLVDSPSQDTSFSDCPITLETIEALDFLFYGRYNENILPLSQLVSLDHVRSGFSKSSKSITYRKLQTWLRSNLTQGPYGAWGCITNGKNLNWSLQGESKETWSERKRGSIATNASFVPKEIIKGNKWIIMSQVSRMTVARSSATLRGSSLKIYRCNDSFLYLLSPLRSVSIEKCQRTTIVLGAVEMSTDIINCEKITVVMATRRVMIQGSKDCIFHMLTPSNPLILNNNSSLTFAPFNTFYPQLEEHLYAASLAPILNQWDKPLLIGNYDEEDEAEEVFKLMDPGHFFNISIPFIMNGKTQHNPVPLPEEYQISLGERLEKINIWKNTLKDVKLDKDQEKLLHNTLQQKFQEFLEKTGYFRHLEDLFLTANIPVSSSSHSQN